MKHMQTISKDAPARASFLDWPAEIYKVGAPTPKQQYIEELDDSPGSFDPENV